MFHTRCHGSRLGTFRTTTAAIMLLLAGCAPEVSSTGDNKAGGAADPVVLRLANTSSGLDRHPALQYFVDRVEELSGRALRIEVVSGWGNFLGDAEQRVVRDVAGGQIELGWVGTSVFDTVGDADFQALTAPMLIDNYPLQKAVLDSDIPSTMLAGLDRISLEGLAVVADGLRKPIAADHPLLGPSDYAGVTFAAFRSQDHADAIRALGAIPTDVVFGKGLDAGLRNGTIEGFEKGLRIYSLNGNEYLAPYVTANVNLWPHTLALFANPKVMADLTDSQRKWLTQASADATSHSTDLTSDDADLLIELCQAGSRFANASEAELAALRHAFEPVYASLDADTTTKAFIDRIEQLKDSTPASRPLDVPAGCTGLATSPLPEAPAVTGPSSALLDGTYRWTITKADALAHGLPSDKTPENLEQLPAVFTVTMTHGTWTFTHRDGGGDYDDGGGTYTVDADRVTFEWIGSTLTFAFSVDGDGTLHLDPQPPMQPGDIFVWATNPWERVG